MRRVTDKNTSDSDFLDCAFLIKAVKYNLNAITIAYNIGRNKISPIPTSISRVPINSATITTTKTIICKRLSLQKFVESFIYYYAPFNKIYNYNNFKTILNKLQPTSTKL